MSCSCCGCPNGSCGSEDCFCCGCGCEIEGRQKVNGADAAAKSKVARQVVKLSQQPIPDRELELVND